MGQCRQLKFLQKYTIGEQDERFVRGDGKNEAHASLTKSAYNSKRLLRLCVPGGTERNFMDERQEKVDEIKENYVWNKSSFFLFCSPNIILYVIRGDRGRNITVSGNSANAGCRTYFYLFIIVRNAEGPIIIHGEPKQSKSVRKTRACVYMSRRPIDSTIRSSSAGALVHCHYTFPSHSHDVPDHFPGVNVWFFFYA